MSSFLPPRAYPFTSWHDVERVAARHFGISAFRPGQRELIEAVLSGRDALGILPTGGGKSLCFQLPSLFFDKAVVVVTPLIALMRDQGARLSSRQIAAVRLDSTLRAGEERAALAGMREGALDLVYVTPEGMRRSDVREALAARGVSLFVVDEAHCVSSWGHSFRPAYLDLADAFEAFALASGGGARAPVLALTATATGEVAADVASRLRLREPCTVRTSIVRESLSLEVMRTPNQARKMAALTSILAAEPGPGIVYASTVRAVEQVWSALVRRGERAARYHGQLPPAMREASQEGFGDERYRVMVATKAFGMGIDKADVRFVVHYEVPDSIESYVQEAGRGGRDGRPARGVLLYRLEDRRVQDYFLRGNAPTDAGIGRVMEWIATRGEGELVSLVGRGAREATAETRVSQRQLGGVLHALARRGVVEGDGKAFVVVAPGTAREVAGEIVEEVGARRVRDRTRLERMLRFAEGMECRWAQVARYFGEGEGEGERCGRCDVCGVERGSESASGIESGIESESAAEVAMAESA